MTTAAYLRDLVIPSALALLPAKMDSPEARALLLAIAEQESCCLRRVQLHGPARSWWQFERTGIAGVLGHPATAPIVTDVLLTLRYTRDVDDLYAAMAHNDILAAAFARLNLWTSQLPLPGPTEVDHGWALYTEVWRPGAVTEGGQRALEARARWDANFARGWSSAVQAA